MAVFEDTANHITVQRFTQGALPRVPFAVLKNYVLGKHYELSVVFPDQTTSISLHKKWKNKNTPVNILSFPLDDQSGEIIMTLSVARSEAPRYGRTYYDHLVRLYIHGLAHLKGFYHGDEMDSYEEKVYSYYSRKIA